jgi:hypothetical protein
MKKILVLLALFVATTSFAFTLSWNAPTAYTDGTPLVGKTIYYDAWADGVRFYNHGTATSVTIPAPGSGLTHLYEVAAVVDNVSSARAGFSWTSPLVVPAIPGNLRVVP